MVAQKCGLDGRLESESVGPFTQFMIQQKCPGARGFVEWSFLHSPRPEETVTMADLVTELVTVGLWTFDEKDECYAVVGFRDLQESDSAERVRRHRSQKRTKTVTNVTSVTPGNVTSNAGNVTEPLLEPLRNGVDNREKTIDIAETSVSAPKQPRQLKMADGDEIRARAILDFMAPHCEPGFRGAFDRAEWKTKNKRFALSLARAGAVDRDIQLAHAKACERLGKCVYMLNIVQDELAKGLREREAIRAQREAIAPEIAEMFG